MSTKGKILVIASHPKSLIIFREHLLREFIRSGYEVSACSPWNDDATISKLHTMGIHYHNIPMKGQGFNIFWDIYSLYRLIRLVQLIKPNIVFGYTIKPVIYGSLAAHYAGTKNIYSIITGLGYSLYGETFKQKIIGPLIRFLYRNSLKYNKKIFFQNPA